MVENRRSAIRMTDTEVDEFVEAQLSLQVATIDRDGSPHLSTLWFVRIDGDFVFETYTKSQKIRNLERDPRITLLLEDGVTYETLRGVMIKGRATLVTGLEEVFPLALALMERNQPDIPEDLRAAAAEHMARKRTLVVVGVERVVSWDHTKL